MFSDVERHPMQYWNIFYLRDILLFSNYHFGNESATAFPVQFISKKEVRCHLIF